ncbi:MAG: SDR family oxidoreductase [Rhizobiaceae bacterium]
MTEPSIRLQTRKALVAGSLGLVGGNVAAHLQSLDDWQVIGLSRSRPSHAVDFEHWPLDLLDTEACSAAAANLKDVTHLFFCARFSDRDTALEARTNLAMLRNLLDPLTRLAPGLKHICLVHGTKWYGSHLGPYRTPAVEDDPRHMPPNYYYDQHDYVAALQRGQRWTWSTVRPHIVCGTTTGYPFNLITLLGVYGSICAELGLPLDFPGTEACFRSVSQATEIGLLCRSMAWMATTPECANQSFNIVNSDYFRWCNLWPRLAEFFGVPMGIVRPQRLVATMSTAEALWASLCNRQKLTHPELKRLANWGFGDFLFSAGWDDMSSTVKARRYGFRDDTETEASILGALAELRRRRVLPPEIACR